MQFFLARYELVLGGCCNILTIKYILQILWESFQTADKTSLGNLYLGKLCRYETYGKLALLLLPWTWSVLYKGNYGLIFTLKMSLACYEYKKIIFTH